MPSALIPLAEGCEELEAVAIIDTLRRAEWEVVSASLADTTVTCSRGVRLVADKKWEEIDPADFDVMVLPGGTGGTDVLRADERVLAALKSYQQAGKFIAAVCAAPLALQAAGVIQGRLATCYPSVAQQLTTADHQDARVVVDGNLITSQGPGTAIEFALTIIREVEGAEKAAAVAGPMLLH